MRLSILSSLVLSTLVFGCRGEEKEQNENNNDAIDTDNATDTDTDTDCPIKMNLLFGESYSPSVVRLFFTLRDCNENGVVGQSEDAFTISEDGSEISIFESEQQIIPSSLGYDIKNLLLLDMSGSIVESGNLSSLQSAATSFVQSLTDQEVAIYAFDGRQEIQQIVDFTDNSTILQAGISSLSTYEIVDNSTNLNGSVIKGLEVLDLAASQSTSNIFEGSIIVFTDGSDQAGWNSNAEAVTAVTSSTHSVYGIGLGGEVDESHLSALGKEGSWTASDVNELETVFEELSTAIIDRANSLYILAYCSPKRNGEHSLELSLNNEDTSIFYSFDATGFEGGCSPADFVQETETDSETTTDSETNTDSDLCPSDMVLIPAQTFDMGCTTGDTECYDKEYPVHSVTLSNDYCMSITEVTQIEYSLLMGSNPSYFANCSGNCPVETVSWHDAAAYANARSAQDGLSACYSCSGGECSEVMNPYLCTGYRLPTEAEWEAAARCGENYIYAGSNNVDAVAWYGDNSGNTTHAVVGKAPNACGLYDMSGNVYEWMNDWYGDYSSSSQTDPTGPSSGSSRVFRGGSWYNDAGYLRVSDRSNYAPSYRVISLGFRLSRSASAQ